jgi:dinuclear metal center YbgI/SA1388 family protein
MSATVAQISAYLNAFAPLQLAEDWDNVGLLVGDPQASVERVMTCLTITPNSAQEAIDEHVGLIVTHHPLPFKASKRITTETVEGRLLWNLIRAGVSIYSPHTAFDSARSGINQRLVEGLGLVDIAPINPVAADSDDAIDGLGSGRFGLLPNPITLDELVGRVKSFLKIDSLQVVGQASHVIRQLGVACGSAGDFLKPARRLGCDCLLTGETRFHTSLEAEATGTPLILAGHYATERFGVEALADELAHEFKSLRIWASRKESDPLRWC